MIKFSTNNQYQNLNIPCFKLVHKGQGLITFDVLSYFAAEFPQITLNFYAETGPILQLIIGTDDGELSFIRFVSDDDLAVYNEQVFSLNNNLTHFWIGIYQKNLFFGTGQKLGAGLKIRYKHNDINSITNFVLVVSGKTSIVDIRVLDVVSYILPIFEFMADIMTPKTRLTYNEFLNDGEPGEKCNRTARVEYTCGHQYHLAEVDELSECNYRVVLKTPYLCPQNYTLVSDEYVTNVSLKKYVYKTYNPS